MSVAAKDDWRLSVSHESLRGLVFTWKRWQQYKSGWDHDHCEFCTNKLMDGDSADVLHAGYMARDNCYWVCKPCFDDFRAMFELKEAVAPAKEAK